MDPTSWVEYFVRVAPALVIAGYGFWIMLGLYREERAANTDLQNYIRESDKKNLEILKDFKSLLDTLISTSSSNSAKILTAIEDEAKEIRILVGDRIDEISEKLKTK
jgi:hypothetical protein